ncbi:hypothetical protein PAMA_020201 [Pampus argenteus]
MAPVEEIAITISDGREGERQEPHPFLEYDQTYDWNIFTKRHYTNVFLIPSHSVNFYSAFCEDAEGEDNDCVGSHTVGGCESKKQRTAASKKPLPQGPPGGVIGILGGVVAIGLIIGVAVTVFMVHRRQQKTRTETDNDLIAVAAVADSCVTQAPEKPESPTRKVEAPDPSLSPAEPCPPGSSILLPACNGGLQVTYLSTPLTDLPPAHKPAPPPPKKKNSDMKGHLTSDDIQVVHLDKEEEMQKLPLQPPYYDMAPSESTPFTDKPNSGHRDCDVQYAELDTSALASSPSPRSSAHTGPGDLVEIFCLQQVKVNVIFCNSDSIAVPSGNVFDPSVNPKYLSTPLCSISMYVWYIYSSICTSKAHNRQSDSGRHPEELLNPAEYVSYQRICNVEHFPESQPAQAYPPVTFLPQHSYPQHPSNEPMYSNTSFSAPGPRAPFTFPKEQSV